MTAILGFLGPGLLAQDAKEALFPRGASWKWEYPSVTGREPRHGARIVVVVEPEREDGVLSGGEVVPGFELPIRELFGA